MTITIDGGEYIDALHGIALIVERDDARIVRVRTRVARIVVRGRITGRHIRRSFVLAA